MLVLKREMRAYSNGLSSVSALPSAISFAMVSSMASVGFSIPIFLALAFSSAKRLLCHSKCCVVCRSMNLASPPALAFDICTKHYISIKKESQQDKETQLPSFQHCVGVIED